MREFNGIRRTMNKRVKPFVSAPASEPMMMGRPDGVLESTRPNMIWVTPFDGFPFEVLNRHVPPKWGTVVNVGYHPFDLQKTQQVLGYPDSYANPDWAGPAVGIHAAASHGFGKYDCDWVEPERILWQIPVPVAGETKADLYPWIKITPTGFAWSFTPIRIDFTAHIPPNGVRICIPVFDIDGEIAFRDGAIITRREDLTKSDWPTIVTGDSASWGLWLSAGMAELNHKYGNDDLIDLRLAGIVGGGSSVVTGVAVEEQDGTPSIANIIKLKFPNGTLTDETGGVVSVEFPANLTVEEIDGTPSVENISTIRVSNGTLTDDGAGQVTINTANALGADLQDLTAQVDGSETHFTFTPAASAILVLVNGKLEKFANWTLDVDGLGFVLSFPPDAGDNLSVLRMTATVPPASPSKYYDYGTSTSAYTEKTPAEMLFVFGSVAVAANSEVTITNLPFTSATSYVVFGQEDSWYYGGAGWALGSAYRISASSCSITNGADVERTINWYAVGY